MPAELGYHGHIHMLIGMNTQGRITGVIMDRNTEPYGDISINKPEFPLQFRARASATSSKSGRTSTSHHAQPSVRAAAREIREASRMVARAVLTPSAVR